MTQLFAGQTTHPLSAEEKKAFFDKIDFDGEWFSFGDERNMRRALETTIQTPLGAQQAREVIHSPVIQFTIKSDGDLESFGIHSFETHDISINLNHFQKDGKIDYLGAGQTIFHEALHRRQKLSNDPDSSDEINKVLLDAETQALSYQMARDNHPVDTQDIDEAYDKSFNVNYQKWMNYAKHPANTPDGFLKFKALPGADETKARHAYAHQMAALETQAQFVKDFIRAPENWEQHALSHQSYKLLGAKSSYANSMNNGGQFDYTVPDELVSDMIQRNPFLKQRDFNDIRQTDTKYTEHLRNSKYNMREIELLTNTMNAARGNTTAQQAIGLNQQQALAELNLRLEHETDPQIKGKNGIFKKITDGQKLSKAEHGLLGAALVKHSSSLTLDFKRQALFNMMHYAPDGQCRNAIKQQMRDLNRRAKRQKQNRVAQNTPQSTVRQTLRAAQEVTAQPNIPVRTTIQTGR